MPSTPDLVVLHEHPEWQKPLFAALARRGIRFEPFDVTRAAFSNVEPPRAPLYFNQASPSAYLRGNTRAVPLALAYMRSLELLGARVLNGADVFALELSKSAQATLLRTLGIDCPRSITFNDVRALRALRAEIRWPALLKPDQGGSGARIQVVDSLEAVEAIFATRSWHLAARQSVPAPGVPAARSGARHRPPGVSRRRAALRDAGRDARPVQPVPLAGVQPRRRRRPVRGAGRAGGDAPPVEFYPFPEVPRDAVETARRIVRAARLDVGGIEYLETVDGRRVFYDINANSNLRPSVAAAFGFDPFERVVDFLERQIATARHEAPTSAR